MSFYPVETLLQSVRNSSFRFQEPLASDWQVKPGIPNELIQVRWQHVVSLEDSSTAVSLCMENSAETLTSQGKFKLLSFGGDIWMGCVCKYDHCKWIMKLKFNWEILGVFGMNLMTCVALIKKRRRLCPKTGEGKNSPSCLLRFILKCQQ